MTKNELRISLKSKLGKMSQDLRLEKSHRLSLNLKQFLTDQKVIQKKCELGVFSPIQMEPLWSLEFEEHWEGLISYPGFEGDQMVFKKTQASSLVTSLDFKFELLVPPKDSEMVKPEILIIPGLGFTKSGLRLGRGKGHYDRYLSRHSVLKVGVAFEDQVLETLPTEAHDEKMNYLVTDQNIYKIST